MKKRVKMILGILLPITAVGGFIYFLFFVVSGWSEKTLVLMINLIFFSPFVIMGVITVYLTVVGLIALVVNPIIFIVKKLTLL